MTCAEFERRLAALAAGEMQSMDAMDAGERPEALVALRRHAAGCPGCEGTVDLLDILDPPGCEPVALFDDPGEAYWADFDARLTTRLRDAGAYDRTGRWGTRRFAAAAAGLVLAVGLWALAGSGSGPGLRDMAGVGDEAALAPLALPGELAALLVATPPGRAEIELWGIAGLDVVPDYDAADDPSDGDPRDREAVDRALLQALERGTAVWAMEDPGWESGPRGLWPDAGSIDADAQGALIHWLEQATAETEGVS